MGYDPIGLRPETVEELAAQERATPGHRWISRKPLLTMLATLALLLGGAGAFALARADPPTELVQPYGPDAPFGVDYVDGFGEHLPKPTPRASSRKAVPSQSAQTTQTPQTTAQPTEAKPSATADSPSTLSSSRMSAVQWAKVSNGKYETFVWVHNEGTAPAAWEVRVRLSPGATVTGTSAVNQKYVDGAWVFTPTSGNLGAGLVYLFSFSGQTGTGRFSVKSCTVNGSACDPFR